MQNLVATEPAAPSTGAGFFDFASTTVETAGDTVQSLWGGLFGTVQTGIETAGETIQTFPESARDVGVAGAEAVPGAAGRAAFGGTVGLGIAAVIVAAALLAYSGKLR